MKNKFAILAVLPLLLSAGACSKFEGIFSDSDLPPLTGERVSILQLQKDLTPDAAAQAESIILPQPWTNKFWPQAGGYPHHVMGHLTLAPEMKKVWSVSVGEGGDRRDPLVTQPIVADGTIFAMDTDGDVSAFDLDKGKRKWRISTVAGGEEKAGAIGGGLAYASGRVFVTNGYKQLLALDPATGKTVWRRDLPSPARSSPAVVDEKLYVITLNNRLIVFSTADGTPIWDYSGVAETTNLLGSVAPAVDASLAVLPLSSGEILGLRVENGQVVWEDNLSAVRRVGSLSSIADIRGQPVIDQDIVYAASYGGRMVAIDKVTGQRIWQREIGSAEMPWSAGDTVFVITAEQQLAALARRTGDVRWVTTLPKFEGDDKEHPLVWTGPVLAGERLIIASSGGEMMEINPIDGKVIRKTELPGDVTVAPVVSDNTLLFLTQKGQLVAYR